MSDILTGPAAYGNTNNTLALKIAWKYWTEIGMPADKQAPQYGDTTNTLLLKIAQYLELL